MKLSKLLKLLVGFGFFLALVGVLLTAGYASTKLLVGDGLDRFTGEERAVAQHALLLANVGCRDNPIGRVLMPKIQVIDVKLEPGYCPVGDLLVRQYRAVVRSYTFFGISAGTIYVSCHEIICR